ncbi:hypothetical protein ACLB2K_076973 [Fragaria x ananassa]
MPPKKKTDPPTQEVDQSQNLGVDEGGTRMSSKLQGHVPSSSENTISDCQTAVIEGSKAAANEANLKRGRPSKKGASNRVVAADSVNKSAVIGQIAKRSCGWVIETRNPGMCRGIEHFKNLVYGFSDEKKAACKALGFGVLLEIVGKRLRKSTVRYLVECVDPAECTIKIHVKTLKISPNDFSRVMGLKNAGKEVDFVGPIKNNPDLMSIVREFSTKEGKSMMVLMDVENYLKNKEALVDEKFKRLFVFYTMCTILTPSASLMIPQKWLLPLRDTSLISSFNWSEHAFKYLMKGISEFQKIP